jgi:hypothetical protein
LLGDEESLEFPDPCTVIIVTRSSLQPGSQGAGTLPRVRNRHGQLVL